MTHRRILLFIATCMVIATVARWLSAEDAVPWDRAVRPLLAKHCAECHGGERPEGGVRLDQPSTDLADAKTRGMWERVYALLVRGEMPPEGKPRLSTDELETLAASIRRGVERAVIAERGGARRTTMRRLTRFEYARLLEDVLGLHYEHVPLQLADKLPADPHSDAPMADGELLTFQNLHLKASVDLVERLVKSVLPDRPRPQPFTYRIQPRALAEIGLGTGRKELGFKLAPEESDDKNRLAVIVVGTMDLTETGVASFPPIHRVDGYLGRDKATAGSLNIVLPYFEPSGELRLRIRAGAVIPNGEGAPMMRVSLYNNVDNERFGKELAAIRVSNPVDRMQDYELEIPLDLIDFPYVLFQRAGQFGVRIANDHMPLADRAKPPREKGQPEVWPWDEPRLVIDEVVVMGPGTSHWPTWRQSLLTAAGDTLEDDVERAAAILREVAVRAWRRPVGADELNAFVDLYRRRRGEGQSRDAALREPLTAVLVSPHAIYLVERKAERPALLSGVELANRLSIFLWGAGPDRELLELAAAGRLSDPTVLAAQTDRLLADKRSRRFVDDFVTRMLALDRLAHDPIDFGLTLKSFSNAKVAELRQQRLKQDLAAEPARYFEHLLRTNRPAFELIGSDYLVVNDRLAHYYGLADFAGPMVGAVTGAVTGAGARALDGAEFRRVAAPDDRRGGWLTMAGVVAAASRGNKEATILRGVYLLDRFLGEHPGTPPGNVEPLEVQAKSKNKGGQASLRERIAQHTSVNTCALCHRKIDPLGFAWADFDHLGQRMSGSGTLLRTGALAGGVGRGGGGRGGLGAKPAPGLVDAKEQIKTDTRRIAEPANDAAVDCSGRLPDGRKFANLEEFAALLGGPLATGPDRAVTGTGTEPRTVTRTEIGTEIGTGTETGTRTEVGAEVANAGPTRYRFGEVLVRRLAGYALSRPLNLSDEEMIRGLVRNADRDGWRLREIIQAIVITDAFTHG